jgi:dTDP-4-amino-4,6-dideoxygalactose transaminase
MTNLRRVIPYSRPCIDETDIQAVATALRSGWLTTGPEARELEREFATWCGVRHAVALASCTAALHLGLRAMDIGPGDEVIMPSLTFVAGAQCVLHLGAAPVFADVDPESMCITPETVAAVVTNRTRVIMPMQYGGYPLDVKALVDYARPRGIRVFEDAAHAVGTLDPTGLCPGNHSDGAAFSFYATKNITSAEGGMFVTNDEALANRVRTLSLHGMDKDAWKRYELGGRYAYDVVDVGYKYNMPDLAAVLARSQLSKLQYLQSERDRLARIYLKALEAVPGIVPAARWPFQPAHHSWCVFAILVQDELGVSRDDVIRTLASKGIGASVHFPPTHLLSAMRHLRRSALPVTEWAAQRLISLPLYPGLSEVDVEYVLESIIEIARKPHALRQ